MTHESILALVDVLNAGTASDRIFLRRLTAQVDFAWVWEQEPTGRSANEGSLWFYFVREANGRYVGAVEDLGGDIHAVMHEAFRRRGIMTVAMRDVVLPHIFSGGKTEQHTRICSPEGRALATKLGFQPTGPEWAVLRADQVPSWDEPRLPPEPLSALRARAVHDRIHAAAKSLQDAGALLQKRAAAHVFDQLGYSVYSINRLLDESLEPDRFDETVPPSLPPLDEVQQREVQRMIYLGASWLRMAAAPRRKLPIPGLSPIVSWPPARISVMTGKNGSFVCISQHFVRDAFAVNSVASVHVLQFLVTS